ncbi:MAG: hypothetical protein ABW082_05250 [Sedimenticola sp.]
MKITVKMLTVLILLLPLPATAGFDEAEKANRAGDREAAFSEYRAAALLGDERAFGKLAGLYLYGVGTERDYVMAYVWFGMSELSGDRYAQGYQGAAASMMSAEQLKAAEAKLVEMRERLDLPEKSPQN